jgi:N6-adenosine-specific RNA methylase IME4
VSLTVPELPPTRDVARGFGTVLIDPPWPYAQSKRHAKQTGYSNFEYDPLSKQELLDMPISDLASPDAVLLLWATWPMFPLALELIAAWGFSYVTALPWVKVVGVEPTLEDAFQFKPAYGVGYWFRGAAEPLLVAKRPKGPSYPSQLVGLLSDNARHSCKPDSVYELAAGYPGPRLEVFARRRVPAWAKEWTQVGIELPEEDVLIGGDVRASLPALVARIRA